MTPIDNDAGTRRAPPRVPGLPLLGNTLQIADAPERFFVDAYERHGPVFRVNMMFRDYVVLAGMEGFRYFQREGERHFSRGAFYDRFARELGTERFILGEPADHHQHLRGQMRLAFSRQVAAPYIPAMIAAVDQALEGHPPGSRVTVMDFIAEIAFDQYSHVMCGRSLRDDFADANHYACRIMNVGAKIWPEFTLGFPRYKRARQRVFALMDELVAENQSNHSAEDREFTIMDAILAAQSDDGSPVATADQIACCLYGFVGTIVYMNRAIAFLLYDLLRNPAELERVRAEIDALYADGMPTSLDLRGMSLLRAALKESMRLHPIALALPFVVEEDFTFEGYTVERGEYCVISGVPGHFAEMFYTEPNRFDPDRCRRPRSEHRPKGAHVPFGFSARVCPAVGLVETIVLCTVTRLLYRREVFMDPPDYELNTVLDPLPGPSRGFRLRLGEERAQTNAETTNGGWQRAANVLEELAGGAEMRDDELQRRLDGVGAREYPAGATIIREGDVADAFHVLIDGEVAVRRESEEEPVARLEPGDHFGEIGLLGAGRRTAHCVALTPVTVLVIERDDFLAIVREQDLVPAEIAAAARHRDLTRRIREAPGRIDEETLQIAVPGARVSTYEPETRLMEEGDNAEHFFVILTGEAEVIDETDPARPRGLARLGSGRFFGEIGILEARPRTATVLAAGNAPLRVVEVPRASLLAQVDRSRGAAGADVASRMADHVYRAMTPAD